jgi:hypothetical protein
MRPHIGADIGVDVPAVVGDVGETLLTKDERRRINKGVAHLTQHLTLDRDSEANLDALLRRAMPVLLRLEAKLGEADA